MVDRSQRSPAAAMRALLLSIAIFVCASGASAAPRLEMAWDLGRGALGIVVSNPGDVELEDLTLELRFPPEVRISPGAAGGAAGCDGGLSENCGGAEVPYWPLPFLAAGDSARFEVRPSIESGSTPFDAQLQCGATVCASATQIATRRGGSLALDLAVSHGPLVPGELATVLVSVANDEIYSAHDTGIRLTLPAGLDVVAESAGASLDGELRTWELGRLSRTEGRRRAVSFRVPEETPLGTLLVFEANASATHQYLSGRLQRSRDVVRVVAARDVEVAGAPIVVLNDRNESGAILDPWTAVGFPGEFAPRPLSLVAPRREEDVDGGGQGTASWSSLEGLHDSNDDSALRSAGQRLLDGFEELGRWRWSTHYKRGAVSLSLAHTTERSFTAAGAEESWRLTFSNAGFRLAAGTVLRFRIPEHTEFASASEGGVLVGDVVEWPIGDIPPGGGGSRSVRLVVDPSVPDGALLRGLAWLVDLSEPQHEEWALGALPVVSGGSEGDSEIAVGADSVEPGATVPVVVSTAEPGPGPVSGTLRLAVSRGVSFPESHVRQQAVDFGGLTEHTLLVNVIDEAQPGALAWLSTSGLNRSGPETTTLVRVQRSPLELPAAGGPAAERCQRDLLRAVGDVCRTELRCQGFRLRNGAGKPAARCYVRGLRRFDRRVARAAKRAEAAGASCHADPWPFSDINRLTRGVSIRLPNNRAEADLDASLLSRAGAQCKREARALVAEARGKPEAPILAARERFVKKFDRKLRGRRMRYSGWPAAEVVHLVTHVAESFVNTIIEPDEPLD
ncbi:MAG: hypothetical protein OEP95_11255 [Myxococcales bacterium]|nr:hypothetical protein [Myxococcales bacterium]